MLLIRFLPLALCGLLLAALSTAHARDRLYFLGYEIVQVIDGDTDEIVADIPVKGFTRDSDLSADRKFLYVTTSRHLVNKIDLATNKLAASVDINSDGWERFIYGFALDPDGKTAYAALLSRKTEGGNAIVGTPVVAQLDLATGKLLRSVEVPWGVGHLLSIKGGKTIYAFGQDLFKIDTTGAELKIVETMPMFDRQMNILPFWDRWFDNEGTASINYYTPTAMGLMLVDLASGDIRDMTIKGDPAMAYSVVLAPDHKTAYGVMDDLFVIDLEKKTYGKSVPVPEGTCYGVNISSDGKKVYAGAGGSTLTVFDAQTLKPLKVLQMASDGMDVRRVTF